MDIGVIPILLDHLLTDCRGTEPKPMLSLRVARARWPDIAQELYLRSLEAPDAIIIAAQKEMSVTQRLKRERCLFPFSPM